MLSMSKWKVTTEYRTVILQHTTLFNALIFSTKNSTKHQEQQGRNNPTESNKSLGRKDDHTTRRGNSPLDQSNRMETIGGDQDSSGCTPTREPTNGLTGGDQLFDKKTGKTETTNGQTAGHNPFNKRTRRRKRTDGQTGGDKPFNKKTGTR